MTNNTVTMTTEWSSPMENILLFENSSVINCGSAEPRNICYKKFLLQVDNPVQQLLQERNSSILSVHVNCTNVTSLMLSYRPS